MDAPLINGSGQEQQAEGHRCRAYEQPFFEINDFEEPGYLRIGREKPFTDSEGLSKYPKDNRLIPQKNRETSKQQRMGVEIYSVDRDAWHSYSVAEQAQDDEQHPRVEEEPSRAIDEEETQRPPTVAKRFQMGAV